MMSSVKDESHRLDVGQQFDLEVLHCRRGPSCLGFLRGALEDCGFGVDDLDIPVQNWSGNLVEILANQQTCCEGWNSRVDEDTLEDIGCRDTIGSGHGMRGVCLWLRFGSAGGTDHEEPRPLTMTDRKRYLVTVCIMLVIMRIRQLNHMVSHHSAAAPTSRHHAFLYMHRLTFTNSLDSLPNQGSLHCLALFRPFPHSMDVFELPVFRWKPFLPFWSDHQATRRSGPGQTGL